jgi:transposase
MPRVLRPDYAQRFLLPPSLDEWAPATHPVRFVSDFVEALDLKAAGIQEPDTRDQEGRPAYAPELLLKIWLFGYMERIRSTRGLERACLQVMPFLWLTGNLHPDHNTLWRFFNINRKALPQLFKRLMSTAAEADLVGFVLHALDGTKMTAASSTDEALHRKSLTEKLKHVDEFVAAYMQEVITQGGAGKSEGYAMPANMADVEARRARIRALLDKRIEDRKDESAKASSPKPKSPSGEPPDDDPPPSSASDGPAPPPTVEPPTDPLVREAEALRIELAAKLGKLDEAGVNHLHEGEPDARMMKGRGMFGLGYNAQIVVDHESDLIAACSVSAQCNDLKQLTPMLSQVRDVYGRVAAETACDGGYDNGAEHARAEAEAMPVIVRLREEPETKGDFSKAHFRYDVEANVYICPLNERLHQIGTSKSHATAEEPDAIYRCSNKTCPSRRQCSSDPNGRKIRRPPGEDARVQQAKKQQDPRIKILLNLRKEIVEHIFGIIKTVDGFRRFTVRGLEKVNAQWALVCLGVNLRKLAAKATWMNGRLVLVSAQSTL